MSFYRKNNTTTINMTCVMRCIQPVAFVLFHIGSTSPHAPPSAVTRRRTRQHVTTSNIAARGVSRTLAARGTSRVDGREFAEIHQRNRFATPIRDKTPGTRRSILPSGVPCNPRDRVRVSRRQEENVEDGRSSCSKKTFHIGYTFDSDSDVTRAIKVADAERQLSLPQRPSYRSRRRRRRRRRRHRRRR